MNEEPKKDSKTKSDKMAKRVMAIQLSIIIAIFVLFAVSFWQDYQTGVQYKKLALKMRQRHDKLTQQVNKLREYNAADWVLPEVRSLIRLARVNLTVNKDLSSAIQLLKVADSRVIKLPDVSPYVEVHTALAKDLVALQSVPKLDTMGLIGKVDAIGSQLLNTPVVAKKLSPKGLQNLKAKESKIGGGFWRGFWNATVVKLKNIVIIRRNERPIEPLQPLIAQRYCQQRIQLMLDQVKWALLNRKTKVYVRALQTVDALVNVCFSHNVIGVQPVLSSLENMQQINIDPAMPTALTAEQAVDEALQTYKQRVIS